MGPDPKVQDFSQRDFREALSTFATGVTIVTAPGLNGDPVGMTVSSFNSVSMDPPLVLWSVTKAALSAQSFKAAKRFAVHVLSVEQTTLSNAFSKSGMDKFSVCDHEIDPFGVPVLADCATRFDCSQWAVYEGGDHWIIVGKVEGIERNRKEGLVFGGGAYAVAAPLTTPAGRAADHDGLDSPADSLLFYHLSRAYHQMGHRIHEAVRDSGLTVGEWRILASLHGEASRSYSELMARTFLDPQSLGDILRSLEADGLCRLSEQDGASFASGTAQGASRVEKLFALSHAIERKALSDAGDEDREVLIEGLKQIVSNTETIGS
ncbi:MAG: flavin reductase [Ahrensia sp.]|nr:flavin reductase [Ahrensia sp.]